mmetsp:Transcript_73565/g.204412  ORF Transcript_73565/g.204412 Transcript_73565/m.204412 type:complete len:318 (-) Transcript_73565:395-1348(-)
MRGEPLLPRAAVVLEEGQNRLAQLASAKLRGLKRWRRKRTWPLVGAQIHREPVMPTGACHDAVHVRAIRELQADAVTRPSLPETTAKGRRLGVGHLGHELHLIGSARSSYHCAERAALESRVQYYRAPPTAERVRRRAGEEFLARAMPLAALNGLALDDLGAGGRLKERRQHTGSVRKLRARVCQCAVACHDDGRWGDSFGEQQETEQNAFGNASHEGQMLLEAWKTHFRLEVPPNLQVLCHVLDVRRELALHEQHHPVKCRHDIWRGRALVGYFGHLGRAAQDKRRGYYTISTFFVDPQDWAAKACHAFQRGAGVV